MVPSYQLWILYSKLICESEARPFLRSVMKSEVNRETRDGSEEMTSMDTLPDIPLERRQTFALDDSEEALQAGVTLRELLFQQKSRTVVAERCPYRLPKLSVIDISEEEIMPDKNGISTLPTASSAATLNMNQRLNQMKLQKDGTSVQMYSQRMVRLRMTQNHRRQILPWFGSTMVVPQGLGSSSTPTVPYSTADILYGNEVNSARSGQLADGDVQNGFGDRDLARQKSKELEQHANNRRPSSKSRKSLAVEAVTFERDKEDPLKNLSSTLPPTKPSNHFRPNGIRTNLLNKHEQLSSPLKTTNGALSGRDQDDLVAMGTLWNPNNAKDPQQQQMSVQPSQQQQQQQQQQAIRSNSLSSSYPNKGVSSSSNNAMISQRKAGSSNIRPIVVQNNVSGKKNNQKEQEDPKYIDPMMGAPASFQQRLIELGALEGDTVRWERTKRLKKKKQDRDS